MTSESDLLPRVLVLAFLLTCWAGVMWLVCYRVKLRDIPTGMPLVFIPIVMVWRAHLLLWRSQRIRRFLQLADDLRMRQKRVDGFLPRRPGR